MNVLEPATIDDAVAMLSSNEDSLLLSGGTAIGLMLGTGLIQPPTLVSMRRLRGLSAIERHGDALHLGARVTLTQVSRSELVREFAPSLATACEQVGNVRVRNAATIAGNVAEADYASDPPAVLVTLDAACVVVGPGGRRQVPVAEVIVDYYTTSLEPGEVIVAVVVPIVESRRTTYQKFVSRSSEDRPCVGIAAAATTTAGVLTALSVTVGAVSSTPIRHDAITAPYLGRALDDAARRQIAASYAQAIEPISDERGSAWYRKRMIEVFVRRALEDITS